MRSLALVSPYGVEALHPDEYVLDLIDLAPAAVARAVGEQATALKNPPMTTAALLDVLRDVGLVQSVARLRAMFGEGIGTEPGDE